MTESLTFTVCLLLLGLAAGLAARESRRGPRRAAFVGLLSFPPATVVAFSNDQELGFAVALLITMATLAFVVLLGGGGDTSAG